MSFSRAQHITHYRPMVARLTTVAKEKWFRANLHEAIGVYSTKQANPKADFEKAMAHFEAIAALVLKRS